MKIVLRLSILLNLLLAGCLVSIALGRHQRLTPSVQEEPVISPPPSAVAATPAVQQPAAQPQPFRWQQLDSGKDYRLFIANLRAIGCPENTIEDIVRGNVGRAFAWERSQQRVDDSASGPWSKSSEMQLVDNLLGRTSTAAASAQNAQNQNASVATAEQEPGNLTLADGNGDIAGDPAQLQFQHATVLMAWRAAQSTSPSAPVVDSSQQPALAKANSSSSGQTPNLTGPLQQNGSTPIAANPQPQGAPSSDSPGPLPQSIGADSGASFSGTASQPSENNQPSSDPYALSGPDIQSTEILTYYNWFAPQAQANAGGGNLNIDPNQAPQ